MKPGFLVVTGMFRSGTTLAQVMIDAHPAARIQYQGFLDFFRLCRNNYFANHLKSPDFDSNSPLGVPNFGSQESSADHSDLLELAVLDDEDMKWLSKRGTARAKMDKKVLGAPAELDVLRDYANSCGAGTGSHVMRQLLARVSELSTGSSLVGFKELFSIEFAPALFSSFGDSVVIWHIIRDPRATLASRNYGSYIESEGGGRRYPSVLIARLWRYAVGVHQLLVDSPNYVCSRYEDLVGNPVPELTRLTNALGIELLPDLFDPGGYRDRTGAIFGGNSSFSSRSAGSTARPDRWREVLSKQEIAAIETMCGPEMDLIGYERSAAHASRLWDSFDESSSQYPDWLAGTNLAPTQLVKSYELRRAGAVLRGAIPVGAELEASESS